MRLSTIATALGLSAALVAPAAAGEMSVSVRGLRSDSGTVSICVFRQPAGFPDCARSPTALRRSVPARSVGKPVLFEGLAPGAYAVTVLHDEDGDGKLGTNLLGIPKEGVGISGNRMPRFSAPGYADARFDLPKGRRQTIEIVYW